MDFNINQERLNFQNTIYQFAKEKLLPGVNRRDLDGDLFPDLRKTLSETELPGIFIPTQYGGSGGDCQNAVMGFEAFSEGSSDLGLSLSLLSHAVSFSLPIVLYGTEFQKSKFLSDLSSLSIIGGFADLEENPGSDVSRTYHTKFEKKGDKFILNGKKIFVMNGTFGDVFLITASPFDKKSSKSNSVFIVEKGFKGFVYEKKSDLTTSKSSGVSNFYFENLELPKEYILGGEVSENNEVYKVLSNYSRVLISSVILGVTKFLYDSILKFIKERKQIGQSMLNSHAVSDKISKAKMKIDSASLLIYRSAYMIDQSMKNPDISSAAKLYTSESALESILDFGEILGEFGYHSGHPIERIYKDLRFATIFGGSSELMKSIVGAYSGEKYEF